MKNSKEKIKKEAENYYKTALRLLQQSGIPFLIGGAFALKQHTGVHRDTKDIDVFCKASDYPRFLQLFTDNKFETEITDARWIAKAFHNGFYVDFIFSTITGVCAVDDTWFKYASTVSIFETEVNVMAAEELLWCKSFVQNRDRYDGADIHHILLKKGREMDWKRVMMRMEQYWEILLAHIIQFRFVYPSERDAVPDWIMEELLSRVKHQLALPLPKDKVCRGQRLSRTEYEVDMNEWGYQGIT